MPAYQANDEGFKLHELHKANLDWTEDRQYLDTGFDVPESGAGRDWLIFNLGTSRDVSDPSARWTWIKTSDIGVGASNAIGFPQPDETGIASHQILMYMDADRHLFMSSSRGSAEDAMPLRIYGAG